MSVISRSNICVIRFPKEQQENKRDKNNFFEKITTKISET